LASSKSKEMQDVASKAAPNENNRSAKRAKRKLASTPESNENDKATATGSKEASATESERRQRKQQQQQQLLERYRAMRIWVEPPEEEEDPDESTLSNAIQDLNDDYLRMVLEILLRRHKEEKEEEKRLKKERFFNGQDPDAAAVVQKKNQDPLLLEWQARKFVEDVNDANCKIYPVQTVHIQPGQSVISEITDHQIVRDKHRQECRNRHRLVECEEDVGYTIKEANGKCRKGKRRARGICRNCKRKTKWFCPACHGTHGAKRAWYCHKRNNPECHQAHLERIDNMAMFFHANL